MTDADRGSITMNASTRQRLHLIVRGRVQMVGYRAFAQREAAMAGLDGWVRNLPDGSVEVEAIGPVPALEHFTARLAIGPRMAQVDAVEVVAREPLDPLPAGAGGEPVPGGFRIRY